MAYPTLQFNKRFTYYFDANFQYLYQSANPVSTPVTFNIYGYQDTTFQNSLMNFSGLTDSNGNIQGTIVLSSAVFPQAQTMVLRSFDGTNYATAQFSLSRNYINVALLEGTLGAMMRMRRPNEVGQMSLALDTITWGFRQWVFDPEPIITLNGSTLVGPDKIKFDYKNGRVYTSGTAFTLGDEWRAEYAFAYLTSEDLYTFLRTTIWELNSKAPVTSFNFESMPNEWENALFLGAYIRALRKILLDLGTFYYRRIFEDPAAMQNQLQSLLASATTEYDQAIHYIKRRALTSPAAVRGLDVGRMPALVDQTNWRNYTIVAI